MMSLSTRISDHAVWPSDAERAKYTVGWIAPMPIELTPARALLDRDTTVHVVNDSNIYQVGRIGNHHVVMVTLGKIGQGDIAYVASYMYSSFRNLKHLLLVGIGGGIPDYALGEQIVLGDVVVSCQVEHLDCGRRTPNGFEFTNQTYYPNPALLKTVNTLRSDHILQKTKIPHTLRAIRQNVHETERQGFEDLGPEADRLFDPDYDHVDRNKSCIDCCDFRRFTIRKDRGRKAHREEIRQRSIMVPLAQEIPSWLEVRREKNCTKNS